VITSPSTYTIQVNDICNKFITKVINVTPSTLPLLSANAFNSFCLDSIKKITLDVIGGKPNYTINWNIPASGITPFDTINNSYFFTQSLLPNSNTYTITVTDQCNNTNTISIIINSIDCNITVPNVVTANGDNINDSFKINGILNFPGSSLIVFNRWGNKIYSNDDYKNEWKPDEASGTYFYILNVSDGRKLNGFFQLFKN
jgi:gliding motility-associated-like protein